MIESPATPPQSKEPGVRTDAHRRPPLQLALRLLGLAVMAGAGLCVWYSLKAKPETTSRAVVPPQPAAAAPNTPTPAVRVEPAVTKEASPQTTALPLRLAGTVLGASPQAILVNTDTEVSDAFVVGAEVLPRVRLAEVQEDRVLLDNQGSPVWLDLGADPPASQPSLNGLWNLYWGSSDEPELMIIEDTKGQIEVYFEARDREMPFLRGALAGRRLWVAYVGGFESRRGDGEFDEAYTEVLLNVVGDTEDGGIESETLRLVRLPQEQVDKENLADARRKALQKVGAALARYADDHGGQLPPSLADLVPTYLSDLTEIEKWDDLVLAYKPGARRIDVSQLPAWIGVPEGEADPAQWLAAYEEACRQVWQSDAPLQKNVLEIRYSDPPTVLQMDAAGTVRDVTDQQAPEGAPPDVIAQGQLRASQENLKTLGVGHYRFLDKSDGYSEPGWLAASATGALEDPGVLTAPWDEAGTSSYELFFPGTSQAALMALGESKVSEEDLNDGTHRSAEDIARSIVPIAAESEPHRFVTDSGAVLGRNVLFLDGHVECIREEHYEERVGSFLQN